MKWWGWLSFGFIFAFYMFDLMHAPLQIFDHPEFFDQVRTEADLKAASDMVTRIQSQEGLFEKKETYSGRLTDSLPTV